MSGGPYPNGAGQRGRGGFGRGYRRGFGGRGGFDQGYLRGLGSRGGFRGGQRLARGSSGVRGRHGRAAMMRVTAGRSFDVSTQAEQTSGAAVGPPAIDLEIHAETGTRKYGMVRVALGNYLVAQVVIIRGIGDRLILDSNDLRRFAGPLIWGWSRFQLDEGELRCSHRIPGTRVAVTPSRHINIETFFAPIDQPLLVALDKKEDMRSFLDRRESDRFAVGYLGFDIFSALYKDLTDHTNLLFDAFKGYIGRAMQDVDELEGLAGSLRQGSESPVDVDARSEWDSGLASESSGSETERPGSDGWSEGEAEPSDGSSEGEAEPATDAGDGARKRKRGKRGWGRGKGKQVVREVNADEAQ